VGKHEADDGSSVHPLIADALTHRPADAGGAHRDGAQRPGGEGEVGWPGEGPAEGDGLGWPVPVRGGPGGQDGGAQDSSTEGVAVPAGKPASTSSRRGWRRLLAFSA
jgi:hypothetical protein